MGFFRSVSGAVRVELTTADSAGALSAIRTAGIELRNIVEKDQLTFLCELRRADLKKLQMLTQRRGETLRIQNGIGLYWTFSRLKKRPVLLIGVTILFLLSLFLPGKVLFVRVEGNSAIPTRLILEKAAACGITLGASTREIRSEQVKNNLISSIQSLQWAGVNTYGCVAVISVRERAPEPPKEELPPVTSIVADRDGIICSVTVQQGTALCKPGDAVTTGQTLISGYTDCGIVVQATQAKGEIRALTQQELTVAAPSMYMRKGSVSGISKNYALIFGKKRINFYKGSGILDATCARIYSEWYVTLPGGFVLPVGVACEQYIRYDQSGQEIPAEFDLSAFAQQYILDHCNSGEILTKVESTEESDSIVFLHGRYACRELLGTIRIEENVNQYGKDS